MKTLIEKIEAQASSGYISVKDVTEILHNQKIIQAKALRSKKSGEMWYRFDTDMKWVLHEKPCGYAMNRSFKSISADAELVTISIIVEE